MSEAVRQFFETLETRVDPERAAGIESSYMFDVDGAGQWTVRVHDGAVQVSEGAEQTDVTISADAATFEAIARGEQNPTTAYMTGKLRIAGDMAAVMKLQKLF